MFDFILSIFADPSATAALSGALGGAFVLIANKLVQVLKAYVLKTPTKVDDEFLEAVRKALEGK